MGSDYPQAMAGARQHFGGLDGLRGIAAIAVMIMHLVGLFMAGEVKPMPAYLAVDLFFMLSGFVLAYAYGAKLDDGMSWRRFMTVRLVRLYPMLLAGVLFGAIVSFTKQGMEGATMVEEAPMLLVPTLFMIPTGLFFSGAAFPYNSPYAFAFNFPVWSLFFELAASAAYATRLRSLTGFPLYVALACCSAALVGLTYWSGTIASLGVQGVIVFAGGFVRVAVPFAVGVILYRSGLYRRFPPVSFPILAIALLAFLTIPRSPGAASDLLAVFLVFPLVICAGALPRMSRLTEFGCDILGRLSYPLYLLHIPVSRAVGFVIRGYISSPGMLIVVTAFITMSVSWLVLILYDEPVRRWLRRATSRRAVTV